MACPDLGRVPVCAAHFGGDTYLLCNYRQLLAIDFETGTTVELKPSEEVAIWYPTGVVVQANAIFVANKWGHDVFEFRRVGDRLETVRRFAVPEMKIPDRVAVAPDGSYVAATDYDGNRLWMFRRSGELAWSVEVPLAHGVAFGSDRVAVTSLGNREVRLYNFAGELLAKVGGMGWGRGRFLWPTSIDQRPNGWLVTDAHSGLLIELDAALNETRWVGGNGPGPARLNMPYSAMGRPNEIVVCDTFKDRVLVLDADFRCRRILSAEGPPTDWSERSVGRAERRQQYVSVNRPLPVAIPGVPVRTWYPAYGGFALAPNGGAPIAWFPLAQSLYYAGGFAYFCWAVNVSVGRDSFLVLGHPQGMGPRIVVVVDGRGRGVACAVDQHLWADGERCRTNSGEPFDLRPAVESAVRALNRFDQSIATGTDARIALRTSFWPELPVAEFDKLLDKAFVGAAGRAFWRDWLAGDSTKRREAGQAFDAANATRPVPELWLQEVFLRNLLVDDR